MRRIIFTLLLSASIISGASAQSTDAQSIDAQSTDTQITDTQSANTQSADAQIKECLSYLKEHRQSPSDYIISKFKDHDIVFLAEDHRIQDNLLMVQKLIPQLYKNGIYNIGMEFGAEEMQAKMDSLLSAPKYDAQLAREMMFYYNTGWAYKEYMDVARAAWEFNKRLPKEAPKFRVLNLSYRFDWPNFSGQTPESMQKLYYRGNCELFRANVVESQIVAKGQKVLILTGSLHAYTHYLSPICDGSVEGFVRFETGTFGNIVYQRHPEKTFTIIIHYPFSNYPGKTPWMVSPANGDISKIMELNGNKACGFDLDGSPLGLLKDNSRVSLGYKDFCMKMIFDGYIFLKPFNKLKGCTVDPLFLNEDNFDQALKYFPDPDWRKPPKKIEEYWEQIINYADLQSSYSQVR